MTTGYNNFWLAKRPGSDIWHTLYRYRKPLWQLFTRWRFQNEVGWWRRSWGIFTWTRLPWVGLRWLKQERSRAKRGSSSSRTHSFDTILLLVVDLMAILRFWFGSVFRGGRMWLLRYHQPVCIIGISTLALPCVPCHLPYRDFTTSLFFSRSPWSI